MYEYTVSAVSPSELPGGTAILYDETEETTPREVESVSANALDPTSIDVSWTPAAIKECLDHYEVCIINTHSASRDCHDTVDVKNLFTDLEPCVHYQLTIASVSPSGMRSLSKNAFATTQDVPTSPPRALAADEITAHTATISHEPPLENPQCVYEYDIRVVQYNGAPHQNSMTRNEPATAQAQEVLEGLEACTDYGLYMSVVTVSGYRSDEAHLNFTTLEDTPSTPRELEVVKTTENSVDLIWFAPQSNGACATSYHLTWTSDSGSGETTLEDPAKPFETKKTVEGLASCSTYTFSVSAGAASGEYSDPISVDAATKC